MGVLLTERAAKQVRKIMDEGQYPAETMLRVGISAGGCSGFSYSLNFDQKMDDAVDDVYDFHGVKVVVDRKSDLYLTGTAVDYYDGLEKAASRSRIQTPPRRAAAAAHSPLKFATLLQSKPTRMRVGFFRAPSSIDDQYRHHASVPSICSRKSLIGWPVATGTRTIPIATMRSHNQSMSSMRSASRSSSSCWNNGLTSSNASVGSNTPRYQADRYRFA